MVTYNFSICYKDYSNRGSAYDTNYPVKSHCKNTLKLLHFKKTKYKKGIFTKILSLLISAFDALFASSEKCFIFMLGNAFILSHRFKGRRVVAL